MILSFTGEKTMAHATQPYAGQKYASARKRKKKYGDVSEKTLAKLKTKATRHHGEQSVDTPEILARIQRLNNQ